MSELKKDFANQYNVIALCMCVMSFALHNTN